MEFIGDSAKTTNDQEAWLAAYFERPDDYCFAVELMASSRMVGMIGIYDFDHGTAEWGRWVVEPESAAAAASAWLILDVCFNILGLDGVRGHVVEGNKEVLSFHRRSGYTVLGFSPEVRVVGGQPKRMHRLSLSKEQWPETSVFLKRYAELAERVRSRNCN